MELPLREIHLPDSISIWPLAIGWWVIFGLTIFLIFLSIIFVRKILKPTLKKQAKKRLDKIEKTYHETGDAAHCLASLSIFLRCVVLSQKHHEMQAGLTGDAWLKLLDKPLKEPGFSQGAGKILITGPYSQSVNESEVSELIKLLVKWVNTL